MAFLLSPAVKLMTRTSGWAFTTACSTRVTRATALPRSSLMFSPECPPIKPLTLSIWGWEWLGGLGSSCTGSSSIESPPPAGQEAEEEGLYKLQPANETDHLCQSWQALHMLHENSLRCCQGLVVKRNRMTRGILTRMLSHTKNHNLSVVTLQQPQKPRSPEPTVSTISWPVKRRLGSIVHDGFVCTMHTFAKIGCARFRDALWGSMHKQADDYQAREATTHALVQIHTLRHEVRRSYQRSR